MNNTHTNSAPGLASLLEGIKGEWRVMPHDDETTAEIHDDLGALCSCEAKFAPLIAAAPAIAASHAELVRIIEQLSGPHGFSLELMTANWCSKARTALANARKIGG